MHVYVIGMERACVCGVYVCVCVREREREREREIVCVCRERYVESKAPCALPSEKCRRQRVSVCVSEVEHMYIYTHLEIYMISSTLVSPISRVCLCVC